jgi:hypothetical protein
VLCVHCGALLAQAGDGLWRDTAVLDRHEEGVLQMVRPSMAQARLTSLSFALAQAQAPDDRERWRLLAEEQLVLMAVVHPGHVAPLPREPRARASFVRDALALQEIATFDPNVRGLMSAYGSSCGDLTKASDPVAVARAMLEAARAYYRALASHADLPPGALREGPEHHARELVRSGIAGYASLVGAGVIERIRTEVLGDAQIGAGRVQCPKCGAPLEAEDLTRCRHCGAVTRVDTRDAWTEARLALWHVTLAELVRRKDLDGPGPVIAAIGSFLYTQAADVPAEQAAAFLARAIPWVTTADLAAGLDILSHGAAGGQLELLGRLRRATASWAPDPSKRPVPPPAVVDFDAPTEADEAAWVESALALWSYRKGTLLDLLGQALVAIHIAATMEKPAGVSPLAAMTFFERASPGFDRTAMLVELRKLQPGYDSHPRVAVFTAALARLLSPP